MQQVFVTIVLGKLHERPKQPALDFGFQNISNAGQYNGKTVNVLDPKATQFKISDLKSGVYFLTISAGEIQEVIKIIKE
jgi:hypothetical protein